MLAYWISERERIRVKKEDNDPRPWSDDTVFQWTYFCNVHREDDRVTRWIRANYTPSIFGDYYEVAIVAARLFNWPSTLEKIKFDIVPSPHTNLWKILKDLQESRTKIWGGAYLITTHGRKMGKIDYCVELIDSVMKMTPATCQPNCEDYWHWFKRVDGLGSFLSAQIVADLKNTKGHPLFLASDWKYFSAPGPGSLRGLSWYWNRKITPASYEQAISDVAIELNWDFCMQDLQNCLCEYDKYCRVLTGTGKSKRGYAAY